MRTFFNIFTMAALLAGTAGPALAQMGHGPPVPMTPAQFAEAASGASVQIEIRIRRVNRSALDSELLARETDTLLTNTGKTVSVFFSDGTPVIMGAPSDVTAGAVLYVYGILTKPGHVDAKRVVVVTKLVTVQ